MNNIEIQFPTNGKPVITITPYIARQIVSLAYGATGWLTTGPAQPSTGIFPASITNHHDLNPAGYAKAASALGAKPVDIDKPSDPAPCDHRYAKTLLAPGPVARFCPDCQQSLPVDNAQPSGDDAADVHEEIQDQVVEVCYKALESVGITDQPDGGGQPGYILPSIVEGTLNRLLDRMKTMSAKMTHEGMTAEMACDSRNAALKTLKEHYDTIEMRDTQIATLRAKLAEAESAYDVQHKAHVAAAADRDHLSARVAELENKNDP